MNEVVASERMDGWGGMKRLDEVFIGGIDGW